MSEGTVPRLLVLALLLCTPSLLRAQPDSTYRITSSRYRLELFPSEKAIRCTDTIEVRLGAGASGTISFRFFPLYRVSSVTVDGRAAPFELIRDRLSVRDVPHRDSAEIIVTYAGRLPAPTEFAQIGDDRAVFHEEGVVPTGLYDLRSIRGAVTVPRGWDAIAAGALSARLEAADSVTFVWESDQPLPSVGWICAGRFARESIRDGNIELATFLAPEDSASAPAILARAKDVLAFYGLRFSPYRFPKLSIVEVDNSVAGKNVLAIASPSFIMVKKFAFETKDAFNQVHAILPHEIAHQWWPATVYVNDEDVALLSEGMCEYSALLYAEASGNMSSRDSLGHHPLLRLLLARVAKGEDKPLRQKADLRALPTHYLKASYVHNMLRAMLGDSLFSRLYAEYASRFALRRASMEDFQGIAERLAGGSLDWFFRQWVTGTGIPRLKIYNVKTAQPAPGGAWVTRGRVRMIGYEKYTALVRVGVETPGGPAGVSVSVGADATGGYRNDVPFEIRSPERPTRAVLDPDGGLLKIQKIAAKLGELRDRGEGVMIVGTAGADPAALARLARRDSAAMEVSGWSIAIKPDTLSTLADLQRENVFLYGTTRENRVAGDLAGKFPMTCAGDSVVVEGETLRDSLLALIQAVESPYLSSGTLVWIAPLTPAASPELLPYDASWVLVRGTETIAQGVWEVRDDDLVVALPAGESPPRR